MPVTDISADMISGIAIQLPLLFLFIWYNERTTRRFDAIQKERDQQFLATQKERDSQFLASIEKVTNHVSDAVTAIKEHDMHVERRIQELRTDAVRPYRRKTDDIGE